MKKTIFTLSLAVMALMIVSCNNESEYHTTDIPYPYHFMFADHTLDSLVYITTEPHTLSTEASWCTLDVSYIASLNEYIRTHEGIYTLSAIMQFEPNTTGKTRDASIHINAGEYSSVGLFRQLSSLNITRPVRLFESSSLNDSLMALTVDAVASTDSVCFTVEGNWTLTAPEGSFVSLERTVGKAGDNYVRLTVPANTGDERKTTLELTTTVPFKKDGTYRDYTITDHIDVIQKKAVTEN